MLKRLVLGVFFWSSSLSEITFEEGSNLKKIGEEAFCSTGLKSFRVPKSVKEIGHGCFWSSSLSEITFEEGSNLKKIGVGASHGTVSGIFCSVKSFRIPKSVEEICPHGFHFSGDVEITFEEGSNLKKIGDWAFAECPLKSFRVPKSVVEIGCGCFSGNSIYKRKTVSEITFEEGSNLKKIGNQAFCYSGLKSFRVPKSVEEIGYVCFSECESLSEITFEEGSNLKKIRANAFSESGLKSFRVPKSVEKIGHGCFSKCESLSEITFEEGSNLKKIGANAFYETGLKSFRVPKSVEKIGSGCFSKCESLSEITFEEGSNLKKIGANAFYDTGLKSFRVPRSVEEIGYVCFSKCESLSEITFEEGSNLKEIAIQKERFFRPRRLNYLSITCANSDLERLSGLLAKVEILLGRITEVRVSEKPLTEQVQDITEYERIKTLGKGGLGEVFLYKEGDSQVAAKFIPESGEKDQEWFMREMKVLMPLSNPFIVGFRGFTLPSEKTHNNFVIIMDYISGGSLHDVMKNPPSWFDNTSRIEIICGIALGMSFVHSNDILHMNLKPANVLLDEHHLPRVCDFGWSHLTQAKDTLRYQAPEVYDDIYTMKMDVYSFGIMLYELVTGKIAFEEFTQGRLMKHVIFGKREEIPETVTPFTRDLIEKCWAQEPESRPSFDKICALLKNNLQLLFKDYDFPRLAQFYGKYFS